MLQRSLTVIGWRTKAVARAGPKRSVRSLGSNAKIARDNTPPVVPKTTTSSSAMMKMKPSKPSESSEVLKHLNAYFPINPTRYDLDESTMNNVQWRESGRAKDTAHMLEFYGITPDLVQPFVPRINLVVKWPSTQAISFRGNRLTPTEVRQKPEVSFETKGKLWTLIMTDPDAPTPEDGKEWLHWLVVNIPGNRIAEGKTIVDYVGAAPPKTARYHRYVFLLAEQKEQIDPEKDGVVKSASSSSAEGRYPFNTPEFIAKYNLKTKGASFFHAQWDEVVPDIYKSIGIPEIDLTKKQAEKKIESANRYTRM